MYILISGVLLWIIIHFIPGFGPQIRATMIKRLGKAYRAVFSLLIFLSIYLMVTGWQSVSPRMIFENMDWAPSVSKILIFVAIYLIASAKGEATVRHHIRHPMLMGVGLWAAAHLLSNGDDRSVVLFTGFILWTLAQMIVINIRDGEWQQPPVAPIAKDIRKLVSTTVLYLALMYGHPYFTGVAII